MPGIYQLIVISLRNEQFLDLAQTVRAAIVYAFM